MKTWSKIAAAGLLCFTACASTTSGTPVADSSGDHEPLLDDSNEAVQTPADRSYDADLDEARLYAKLIQSRKEPHTQVAHDGKRKPKPKREDKTSDDDFDGDDFFDDDDDDTRDEPDDEPTEVAAEATLTLDTLTEGAHTLRHTIEDMDVVEAVFVTDRVIVTAAAVTEGRNPDRLASDLNAVVGALATCYARFHDAHGAMSLFAMISSRTLDSGGVGFYLVEVDQLASDSELFPALAKEIDGCTVTKPVDAPPALLLSQLRARYDLGR